MAAKDQTLDVVVRTSTRDHSLVKAAVYAERWAMLPEYAQRVYDAINGAGDKVQAAELRASRIHDETRDVEMLRSGIAVIPIYGVMIPRASGLMEWCGVKSTEGYMKDFAAAMEDPQVKSIIFLVDSPGGATTGISELSTMLYNARGKKHVTAFVRGLGASAAYWSMSGAEELIIGNTAQVGSIGTLLIAPPKDPKAAEPIVIRSAASPKKHLDPASKEGQELYQALVDELTEVFVSEVSRNRGVPVAKVLSDFGQGFVLIGDTAVKAGMADGVSTFEDVVLQHQKRNSKATGAYSMTAQTEERTFTQAEFDAAVVAAEEKGRTEGLTKGAESERARIQAIEGLKVPAGYEKIVQENKFKPEATADSVSRLVMEAVTKGHDDDAAGTAAAAAAAATARTPDAGETTKSLLDAFAEGANARISAGKES